MGGNAIENARRIPRSEYFELVTELQDHFPELKMKAVRAFHQKKDFGDIDIVVEIQPNLDIPKLVKERLKPEKTFSNNMFFSFEYKGAQIDFISMSKEDFVPCLNYFAWNDLGNFIGRTARSLNLKYGHEGLCYELRLGDHFKKTVVISRDTKRILDFLDYDYDQWLKGFETEADIFAYAASSKYFNTAYFTLEEQSHNDRVRNKKRKMYQKMLAYIQEHGLEDKPRLSKEERDEHYGRARLVFGNAFHKEVEEATKEFELDIEFKKYFNGDVVKEWLGLEGKALGTFMSWMRKDHPHLKEDLLDIEDDEERKQFIYDSIYETLMDSYAHYTEPKETLDKLSEDTIVYDGGTSMSAGISLAIHRLDGTFYQVLYHIYGKEYTIERLSYEF